MCFSNKIMIEAAKRAGSQIDKKDYEIFDELYGGYPDSMDYSKFSFGQNKDYWDVVANILEGNIVKYDSVEEYGKMLFDKQRISQNLDNFFNFRAFGEELRYTLDEEHISNLLAEGKKQETYLYNDVIDKENETLAQNYVESIGGIKVLDSEIRDTYFDYEAFGESELPWQMKCGDVTNIGSVCYDLSSFDCDLGERLEKNMALEVSKGQEQER